MIRAEIRLIPAMSTTEYIIVDVVGADVRARVARRHSRDHQLRHADRQRAHRLVTSDEPPEPPSAPIASSRPSACRRGTTSAAPRAIAATAAPRSPAAASAATSAPPGGCDLLARRRRARASGSPITPASTRITSTPCSRTRSRRYAYSTPFVSSVPTRTTVAISRKRRHRTRARPRALSRSGHGRPAPGTAPARTPAGVPPVPPSSGSWPQPVPPGVPVEITWPGRSSRSCDRNETRLRTSWIMFCGRVGLPQLPVDVGRQRKLLRIADLPGRRHPRREPRRPLEVLARPERHLEAAARQRPHLTVAGGEVIDDDVAEDVVECAGRRDEATAPADHDARARSRSRAWRSRAGRRPRARSGGRPCPPPSERTQDPSSRSAPSRRGGRGSSGQGRKTVLGVSGRSTCTSAERPPLTPVLREVVPVRDRDLEGRLVGDEHAIAFEHARMPLVVGTDRDQPHQSFRACR